MISQVMLSGAGQLAPLSLVAPALSRLLSNVASSEPIFKPANIWCVGRNFADHIKELGNQQVSAGGPPMIFLKAGSTALAYGDVHNPAKLPLPVWSADVHHEVELAIELGADLEPVRGAVSLDLTARDVQTHLKKLSWPWTLAKSFPHSTPLGTPFSLHGLDVSKLDLHLTVNGKFRQHGHTSYMLYNIPTIMEYLRKHFPVLPGDVVLTGTPAGVSALEVGDTVIAKVLHHGHEMSHGVWTVVRD